MKVRESQNESESPRPITVGAEAERGKVIHKVELGRLTFLEERGFTQRLASFSFFCDDVLSLKSGIASYFTYMPTGQYQYEELVSSLTLLTGD